jgi:hypothetical protein
MVSKKLNTGTENPVDEAIRTALNAYEARQAKQGAEDYFETAQVEAISVMKSQDLKFVVLEVSDGIVKATVVEGTRVNIDEEKLKAKVGSKVWAEMLTPQLDKRKLEAQVALGKVSAKVLDECSTEEPNKPYLRFSKRER